ncbi:hypothetical protein [Micromonospora sp. CA-244673]|uniref:hypothetical protein n=1 Tax=Micromonospora sp. CA-244673 TaxID=3239958 RepID=UPI003D8BAC53
MKGAYNRGTARRRTPSHPRHPIGSNAAERASRGLVADLNVIDDEHGLIDTNCREQVWDTSCDLARRLRVPATRVTSWCDEGRRF